MCYPAGHQRRLIPPPPIEVTPVISPSGVDARAAMPPIKGGVEPPQKAMKGIETPERRLEKTHEPRLAFELKITDYGYYPLHNGYGARHIKRVGLGLWRRTVFILPCRLRGGKHPDAAASYATGVIEKVWRAE